MNVLSLFDGMSCGQQALDRNGIKVDNYFASEIDKYAITVTMANYPNTKQLGSVVDVDGYSLPKIDLLIGGSPCQSFSFAGKRKGMATKDEQEILTLDHYLQLKSEGFEFEGQSYLFWEYMRLLYECKPKYFLLENVMMGEKWEKILSRAIGVNPIMINSSLLSAQNRQRLYWTNIGLEPAGLFGYPQTTIEQPKDKGILLKDVLESEVDEKYYLSGKMLDYLNSRKANYNNGKINYKTGNDVASCINAISGSIEISDNIIVHNTMPRSSTTGKGGTGHLTRADGKTYCLDTGTTNAVEIREVKQINPSLESGGKQPYQQNRVYDTKGISPALCANKSDLIVAMRGRPNKDGINIQQLESREDGKTNCLTSVQKDNLVNRSNTIRRLTPIECERLQTVKDNYTNHVSDSQRYKMLGNGWTVDVIRHILNYMKI
jgi:DNA-cytosine methyltransferase